MGRDTLAQVLAPILRTLKPAVENVVHKALRAWQEGDHDIARDHVDKFMATTQSQLDDDEAEARRAADKLPR